MQWILKKYKADKATFIIFAIAYAAILALIYHSAHRPMWFDEAWRAFYIDSNLQGLSGAAPISAGVFGITRLAVLIVDNNLTQRIVTYLFLLALPWIVYKFSNAYFDKLTARVSVLVVLLSGSIWEYSVQNKPYVLDVVCVLGVLYIYKLFTEKKMSLLVFTVLSAVAGLFSFATFFVFPCIGIFLLARYIRKRSTPLLCDLLVWSGVVGLVSIVHLQLFIRPQIHAALNEYWQGLYLSGGLADIFKTVATNLLSFFGLTIFPTTSTVEGLNAHSIFWTRSELSSFFMMGALLGCIYLLLFLYGLFHLVKQKRYTIPLTLLIIYGLQFVAAYFKHWPFGNSRTNIFSTTIILLVACYGAVKIGVSMVKNKERGAALIMIAILLLVFPAKTIFYHGIAGHYAPGFGEGVQASAVMVAKGSKPEDQVLLYHYMTNYRFRYYYEKSSYTKQYTNKSKNILIDYRKDQLPYSVEFFKNNPHDTIWIVVLRGIVYNPSNFARKAGYRVVESMNYQHLTTYKMQR